MTQTVKKVPSNFFFSYNDQNANNYTLTEGDLEKVP